MAAENPNFSPVSLGSFGWNSVHLETTDLGGCFFATGDNGFCPIRLIGKEDGDFPLTIHSEMATDRLDVSHEGRFDHKEMWDFT
ncbi:hypothetical protein KI387_036411, partial [Taxus chinensis]